MCTALGGQALSYHHEVYQHYRNVPEMRNGFLTGFPSIYLGQSLRNSLHSQRPINAIIGKENKSAIFSHHH